jgi:hypothetical protein
MSRRPVTVGCDGPSVFVAMVIDVDSRQLVVARSGGVPIVGSPAELRAAFGPRVVRTAAVEVALPKGTRTMTVAEWIAQ